MQYTILMYICWAIIGVVWLLGALYNIARAPAAAKKGAPTVIFTLIFLGVIFLIEHWGPANLFWKVLILRSNGLADAGSVILLAGTAFTFWARLILGTMWSSSPVAREDHDLKTTGPYSLTRNPIYTGLLAMLIGSAMIKGLGIWVLYIIAGILFAEFKIHLEERLMTETFGERYLRYRQQVPQLIPGLNLLHRSQRAHR